jgi:DNA topoisomerase-6 subunit B
VGRKLGMYMRRRLRVAQEGQRRSIFLRYLGEVAGAVSQINGTDRAKLYEQLLAVAKKKTAEADVKLDDRGRPIEDEEELELGDNCIIVPQSVPGAMDGGETTSPAGGKPRGRRAKAATVSPAAVPKTARRRRR